ncbi:MAG: thiamine pyrophosphate-dependent dehydrogenase E1 component subunit alpha [Alphaproteobacteria bacterium]
MAKRALHAQSGFPIDKGTGDSVMKELPGEILRDLYRAVFRIRRTEETLASLYPEQEMRTPTHFGIGQEAVAAGVCGALGDDDVVYSHHRCHNHYLARGGSLLGLVAELYGRIDGCANGRGGSVHLTSRETGFVVSSAILGQTIAAATGSALAFQLDKTPRVAVTFFGEATCEEGVFYESLNFAAVRRLPVLLVCENNLYSTESPLSVRQPAGTDLCERVRAFKVTAERVDGNDVVAVYGRTLAALDQLRAGEGPVFLECMTYRWREHVGPNFDHEAGRSYRDKAELDRWMDRCPVKRARALIVASGTGESEVLSWESAIEDEIQTAVAAAKGSPWPETRTLFDNIY